MRPRDALVVPRQFLKGSSSSVDGSLTVDGHVRHLVGIDELDGCYIRPQRYIVRFHRDIILEVGAAVECRTLLQIEAHVALQYDGASLVYALGNHHPSATRLRAVIDGLLNSRRTEHRRIRLSAITNDVKVGRVSSHTSCHQERKHYPSHSTPYIIYFVQRYKIFLKVTNTFSFIMRHKVFSPIYTLLSVLFLIFALNFST